MGGYPSRKDKISEMTRDERRRWLFAHMDGRQITFEQKGMPFRVMQPDAEFGGVAKFKDTKCGIRIVHKQDAEKGKRYEVRFPDKEWQLIPNEKGQLEWTNHVETSDTTLVGYMEITGNWKKGEGKCIFHPILKPEGDSLSNG